MGSCGYLEGGEKMTSEQGNIGPDLFQAACRDWDWRAWSASIATMTERPVKITFGEMRDSGVRGTLICADYHCRH